LYPSAGRL